MINLGTLNLNMNSPINVLIGENGCGKSYVLSQLARDSVEEKESIIAIATSVYDKFPRRNLAKNYHYMGARLGRFIPREAVKQAISRINSYDSKGFFTLFQVLDYVGYDQRIGFKVSQIEYSFDEVINNITELDKVQKNDLGRVFYGLKNHLSNTQDDVLWLERNHAYHEIFDEFLTYILLHEKTLKKYKLIKSIDIYLSKQKKIFPLSHASSGELSIISTLLFISSFIKDDTLILIDEPENSLHPKWQKEFISMILDLFSYYEPNIIVATHSPIVISGLHKELDVEIHKYTVDGFIRVISDPKNAESIYDELFDIVTPASRELSNRCAGILNDFSENKISLDVAENALEIYKEKSYDDQQIVFIDGIKELLVKIQNNKAS